ncbi:MAG TPA: hypothetical protein PLM14_15500 [Candidatus Hydrogenedentes bacterium]|nr:hypothetical protein [Candidatus Hydrogenedentota bacterium]HQE84405.1 hypothetical protein [Candidatus Hydrogenedentota bacterium]HQM50945.1 hypothetical protein [Candidatus Hydrogenedentota bacterium]
MRLIQAILWRAMCAALLVLGVLAFYVDLTTIHEMLVARIPDSSPLRWGLGCLLIVVAIVGLVPWPQRARERRKIAFKGAHGNVSIQLDSVEQTLNRATRKITEAKRINARITPSDNARNVHIQADVTLRKPANVSAREVEAKVSEFIVDQTKRILGDETAVTADLNIVDIIIEDSDRPTSEAAPKQPIPETPPPKDAAEERGAASIHHLEEEEEAGLAEPSIPGTPLPEPGDEEELYESEEPDSEENEEAGTDEEKNSLW